MSQTGVEIKDVQAQTITISGVTLGLTAPEVQELTKAAAAGAVLPLADKIIDLSQKLGVTQGALRTLLKTVGLADVPDERLIEKLTEVVEHYRNASAEIGALRPDNPIAREHAEKAKQAADSGDRNEARHHLQAARSAAAAAQKARQLAREAGAVAENQMLQAARVAAAEAELALTALNYGEAAQLFEEAASLVPERQTREKGILLWRQADALQR
ncbi:MAG: hypothetical protein JOZ58_12720, partial [Acetobacteraceae bacterium]|nr:hypothetical protein [Acetobacteraceae bacterium]